MTGAATPEDAVPGGADRPGHDDRPGRTLVLASAAVTAALGAASVMAVLVEATRALAAAVGLVAFAGGTVAFAAALVVAARRSRHEELSIGGLLLAGSGVPKAVVARLYGLLAVQTVATVTAAALRPYSVVAFLVLGPLAGLGVLVLWGARFGSYPPRQHPGGARSRPA